MRTDSTSTLHPNIITSPEPKLKPITQFSRGNGWSFYLKLEPIRKINRTSLRSCMVTRNRKRFWRDSDPSHQKDSRPSLQNLIMESRT